MSEPGRWSTAAHVLDFDDLHIPSTAHISAVCLPAAVAVGGDQRAYLAGAGVMARLGMALGWRHYASGWHATCTAGAPAAAVSAGVALGLSTTELAHAIALAVPSAGGTQTAFGTDGKSLQVGFAAEAGVRAARLAAAGACADPRALETWMQLVHGTPHTLATDGAAIPGGLAIKLYPCCYALQRPIAAVRGTGPTDTAGITNITIRTPASSLIPLIHHRPQTALEAKFSVEYAVATALLDSHQGFAAFDDAAVARPEAQRLMGLVSIEETEPGDGLLTGEFQADIRSGEGQYTVRCQWPPGSPQHPPTLNDLDAKINDCLAGTGLHRYDITWSAAASILRRYL